MRLPRTVSSYVWKIFKDRESKHMESLGPQLQHSRIIINILVRFLLAHSLSLLRSPLKSSPALQRITAPSHLGAIHKALFCHTARGEDVEGYQIQH